MRNVILLMVSAWLSIPFAQSAEPSDFVSFVVVGKTTNHRQVGEDSHHLLNYHFFAEIFLRDGAEVMNASLIRPSGETMFFTRKGQAFETHGGRYTSEQELDAAYPNGTYTFVYSLPNGQTVQQALAINNPTEATRIPAPPTIELAQQGATISPQSINPDLDLEVRWSNFELGNADRNKIVDDLIFVITGDCRGNKIDHSGGPFGQTSYLTYASDKHVIPASKLGPGRTYQLAIEYAEMDTSRSAGIPEIATFAATSFLDLKTTGPLISRPPCPQVMPAMNGGQTDRPQKVARDVTPAPEPASKVKSPDRLDITEQHVMLYYKDLTKSQAFYQDLLGLAPVFEEQWVKIFQVTPTSFLGLVQEGKGYHRVRKKNAVMISIVTTDVDGWYRKLKAADNVTVLKEIYNHESAPIRAFLVSDPGGYTVEFFQWLRK